MAVSVIEKFESLKKPQQLASTISGLNKGDRMGISAPSGSAKILLIKKLTRNLKEIIVLFPDIKQAEEFFVETDITGISKKSILINDFKPEALQEKITEIINKLPDAGSAHNGIIIISTYELLNHKFPSKERIDRNTTIITAGGNITDVKAVSYTHLDVYKRQM